MGRLPLRCAILFSCMHTFLTEPLNTNTFPEGFLFGVASSAYQIEGGWNADGKDQNVWDVYTHGHSDRFPANADVSCNSYEKYPEDVKLLKHLGVDVYKFSLSWSRIVPFGLINHDGLDYYNRLIDALVEADITPMVTLFRWDTPERIQSYGGWTNPLTAGYFLEYARLAFETFGDRVKYWITFDDPLNFCLNTYGEGDADFAPGVNISGRGVYLCAYVALKTHAAAYNLYKNNFRKSQGGLVSISLTTTWCEPGSKNQEDTDAAHRLFDFQLGLFANPIFGNGRYPNVVRKKVNDKSLARGYLVSRLPSLTSEESEEIKGTFDFFALNFYTSVMVSDDDHKRRSRVGEPSFYKDADVRVWFDSGWNTSSSLDWLKVTPWGLRKLLNKVRQSYGDVPIFITENGFADGGETEDYDRIHYHQTHLSALLEAIHEDEVKVMGYVIWSFLDSFEWSDGYNRKFGLYRVDFDAAERTRIPKLSSVAVKEIIKNRKLPTETTSRP